MIPDLPQMSREEARKRFPPIWVIYDHPKDYPLHFLVRCWYGEVPDAEAVPCDSLAEPRRHIASVGGCVLIPRDPRDDPVIVESWL